MDIEGTMKLLSETRYAAAHAPAGPIRIALNTAARAIEDAAAMMQDVIESGVCPGCGGADGRHAGSCTRRPASEDLARLLDSAVRLSSAPVATDRGSL